MVAIVTTHPTQVRLVCLAMHVNIFSYFTTNEVDIFSWNTYKISLTTERVGWEKIVPLKHLNFSAFIETLLHTLLFEITEATVCQQKSQSWPHNSINCIECTMSQNKCLPSACERNHKIPLTSQVYLMKKPQKIFCCQFYLSEIRGYGNGMVWYFIYPHWTD